MVEKTISKKTSNKTNNAPKKQDSLRQKRVEGKAVLLKMEKTNRDHIYLLASTNGWWKIMCNSLLFYFDLVAPALTRSVTRMADKDYEYRVPYGVAPFSSIEAFEKTLVEADSGIKEDKDLDFGEFSKVIKAYKLPAAYTEKDVKLLHTQDAASRDRFSSRILDVTPDAKLAAMIREACLASYNLTSKLNGPDRKIFNNRLFDSVMDMVTSYHDFANENDVRKQNRHLAKIFFYSGRALLAIEMFNFTRVFSPEVMESATFKLVEIRDYTRRELEKRGGVDAIKQKYDDVRDASEVSPL